MSAQINTTKYLIGKSPYGDIRAKVEYTLEKITLALSYSSLAEILIRSNQPNLDTLNLRFIVEIEDDTKEPGTIIQEIQKGFTIKDRLLRPSLVGVSKKVIKKEEKTNEIEENKENK